MTADLSQQSLNLSTGIDSQKYSFKTGNHWLIWAIENRFKAEREIKMDEFDYKVMDIALRVVGVIFLVWVVSVAYLLING